MTRVTVTGVFSGHVSSVSSGRDTSSPSRLGIGSPWGSTSGWPATRRSVRSGVRTRRVRAARPHRAPRPTACRGPARERARSGDVVSGPAPPRRPAGREPDAVVGLILNQARLRERFDHRRGCAWGDSQRGPVAPSARGAGSASAAPRPERLPSGSSRPCSRAACFRASYLSVWGSPPRCSQAV